jgi:hypothetical protein
VAPATPTPSATPTGAAQLPALAGTGTPVAGEIQLAVLFVLVGGLTLLAARRRRGRPLD